MSDGHREGRDEFALLVNFPVSDAISDAPADAERAAAVLQLAAKFMRERQPLPYQLADYLAGAFEAAMAKPADKRAMELAQELNLKARNRRPVKFLWHGAHAIAQQHEGKSQTEIVAIVVKQGKVSKATALRLLRQAEREMEIERQRRLEDRDTDF